MANARIAAPIVRDPRALARAVEMASQVNVDDFAADRVDIARDDIGRGKQLERADGEQAGAGPDIGNVSRPDAAPVEPAEHGEAPGGGLVLPGAECAARRDYEVDRLRVGRIVGRADMEGASAHRVEALLAERHPVDRRDFLGKEIRRVVAEQVFETLTDRFGWAARIPRLEPPGSSSLPARRSTRPPTPRRDRRPEIPRSAA